MNEDKNQRQPNDGPKRRRIGETPREGCEKKEEGEQVGERWIRAMPGILRFWKSVSSSPRQPGQTCRIRIFQTTYVSLSQTGSQ